MILQCEQQVSHDYMVPMSYIESVIRSNKADKGKGIGPMGIPAQWMSMLQIYGFSPRLIRTKPCWGIAAGTWILAIELRAHEHLTGNVPYNTTTGRIPTSLFPHVPSSVVRDADLASQLTGVPKNILLAVAWQESGFNPNARSDAGAQGLMQFIPSTWAAYGKGSPYNEKQAMLAGAMYLRHLAVEFNSWKLAFAGYNAGGQAVRNYHGIPPYRQTQLYVPAVLGKLDALSKMGQ